jgi:hypothetical protein
MMKKSEFFSSSSIQYLIDPEEAHYNAILNLHPDLFDSVGPCLILVNFVNELIQESLNQDIDDYNGEKNDVIVGILDSGINTSVPYLITENKSRKQEYTDYSIWELTFTRWDEVNYSSFKKTNKGITKAIKKMKAKKKAKAKAQAKESWDDAHMSPAERTAKMREEQKKQIEEANERIRLANERYEAVKVEKKDK